MNSAHYAVHFALIQGICPQQEPLTKGIYGKSLNDISMHILGHRSLPREGKPNSAIIGWTQFTQSPKTKRPPPQKKIKKQAALGHNEPVC